MDARIRSTSAWSGPSQIRKLRCDQGRCEFYLFSMLLNKNIKGFLRRVHRWPVYVAEKERRSPTIGRRRGRSLNMSNPPIAFANASGSASPTSVLADGTTAYHINGSMRILESSNSPVTTMSGNVLMRHTSQDERSLFSPTRRTSEAEQYLKQYRREIDAKVGQTVAQTAGVHTGSAASSPRTSRFPRNHQPQLPPGAHYDDSSRPGRRYSLQQPTAMGTINANGISISSSLGANRSQPVADVGKESSNVMHHSGLSSRPRLSRSPSAQTIPQNPSIQVPSGLKDLLDGTRHADELGVQFDAGWPLLEKFLVAIGGGKGDGDFGSVEIIYR